MAEQSKQLEDRIKKAFKATASIQLSAYRLP